MFQMIVDTVVLRVIPTAAVTYEGGDRALSERTALDGRVIATRPLRASPLRITISAPGGFAISDAQAGALQSLFESGASFDLTLTGYEPAGTYHNVTFAERPRFPFVSAGWRGYQFTLYVPQETP